MNSKKKCIECGKFIENKYNKFCDSSCAAKYNNRKYPKRIKTIKNCPNCGKKINTGNKFCNASCFNEFKFKNVTLPLFYEGKTSTNFTLKKILIYLFGDKCMICSNDSVWENKPLMLQIDHIDGNSDNNFPNNVQLLCPNCHSQTETFCGGCEPKDTKRNKYLRNYKSKLLHR